MFTSISRLMVIKSLDLKKIVHDADAAYLCLSIKIGIPAESVD